MGRPELLTDLTPDAGVPRGEDSVPKGHSFLGAGTRAREGPWPSRLGHVLSRDSRGHRQDSQEGRQFVSSPNEYRPAAPPPAPGPFPAQGQRASPLRTKEPWPHPSPAESPALSCHDLDCGRNRL